MKKIFWGLFFILAAAFLILDQVMLDINLSLFNIFSLLILIPMFIQSIIKLNFGPAMFAFGFLAIIFKEYIYLAEVSNWTIFLAAMLLGIGLEMLFGKKRFKKKMKFNYNSGNSFGETIEYNDESHIDMQVTFGSGIRYIDSPDFQSANLDCTFGSIQMYFDNASIVGDSATITVNANFAGVELYIPKEWQVINKIDSTLSGVDINRNCTTRTAEKKIYLEGSVNFTGVDVKCI